MSKRRDPNPEFDFFIPLMNDLPLKDQREVMGILVTYAQKVTLSKLLKLRMNSSL